MTDLQQLEYENKYYKLLTLINNIMGMLDTVKVYLISNDINIMPLSSILKDLNTYSSRNIEDFEIKYNNLLFMINRVISKLDFTRFIYKNDLFIINMLNNIIDKLNNCANLNYKALYIEYQPTQQTQIIKNLATVNNNDNNNKQSFTENVNIQDPKPIEIKINSLVKSENVVKEAKKQETKETNKNNIFNGVYVFENAQNLKSMFYNSNDNKLLMTFKKSNKTYLYNNVENAVISELIKHDKENNHATSYFNNKVVNNKNKYDYKLIA